VASRPERRGRRQRLGRQAAARRVARAAWSVRLSERPHSEALPVRRDAAVAPSSCLRQAAVGRPSAALPEPAWWQAARVMAPFSEMKAAVVAESVRPVASAPRARLPAEEAAVASGAKAQPQEAAEVLPVPSAQQPVAAAEARGVSAAEAQPREAAEAASDAEEAQPPEAAGVALDAVAEPQLAVAAGEPDAAAVQQPVAAAEGLPDEEVQRLEAGHPSAPPSWRLEDHPHPWLAPRRAARTAHAMRRSRTASPSKRSWRAAGCEDLS
jgi:hypothetical protein